MWTRCRVSKSIGGLPMSGFNQVSIRQTTYEALSNFRSNYNKTHEDQLESFSAVIDHLLMLGAGYA